ncbi:MAG: hypothetical protein EAZ07_00445 [Cytophagales bacterium]|nr:MAG: hypothetical protein EAZ07_00445 [Cytophagales bacterium]
MINRNLNFSTLIRLVRNSSFLILFALVFFGQGCKSDKVEEPALSAATCDTANVKFSTSVFPIIEKNCNNCHGASKYINFGSGINLSNYDEIAALKTEVVGTIKQEEPKKYSPMPKGAAKLSACDIAKVEAWVRKGAKND